MSDELESAKNGNRSQQVRIELIRRSIASGGADAARMLGTALARADADFLRELADNLMAIGAPALATLRVVAADANPQIRMNTVHVLARFTDPAAVELLVGLLKDSDPAVRINAADALGKREDKRAVDGLCVMARGDSNTNCRRVANSSLRAIGTRLLAPHLSRLTSEDPNDRNEARRALVAEGGIVVAPLSEMLDHGNPLIRRAVVEVLGEIADPSAVAPLIRAMTDPDDDVRTAVIHALGQMRSEKVVRALIANLTNADDRLATDITQALLSQGGSAVPPLLELLDSGRRELRTLATDLLSRLRDRRATQPLIRCLAAPDSWLRAAAARALGRLGDSDANDAVVALLSDPVPLVRAAVAEALGELHVARATPPLIAALDDAELIVQVAAAHALGQIGDESATEPLIQILNRDDPTLRVAAIEALADARDPRALPVVKRLLGPWPFSQESPEVKNAARKALELLQPHL